MRGARRRILLVLATLVMLAGLLETCAFVNLGRLRAEREYLGTRLYVETMGAGPAIVFLPGLMASTRYWNREKLAPLALSHRLIFLDESGFGRSPWPDSDYTLDDHLSAIRRTLVSEQATSNVIVIGHSFGAILAAYYAARYPSEVDRVYLFGTPTFENREEARRRIREMSRFDGIFTLNRPISRFVCRLHAAGHPILWRITPRFQPDIDPAVAQDALLHWWPSFDGSFRNVIESHPVKIPLEALGARVIFIHGRRDGVTPLAAMRFIAHRIGARVIETDDAHRDYGGASLSLLRSMIPSENSTRPTFSEEPKAGSIPR